MDTEKKPKRPRIGAGVMAQQSESVDSEMRYEKVNYPGDGTYNQGERNQRPNYGGYQPRQQYGYNNRQGGYNNHQGGYNN